MTSKSVITPFIISLLIAPLMLALTMSLSGEVGATTVTRSLFAMTVLVEVFALAQALGARKIFSPSDPGRRAWTLIAASLGVRLVTELRLVTLTFNLVPKYSEGASRELFFYVVVLRYLNILSGLLLILALITMIRAYKSTGLKFELEKRDSFYIVLLWAVVAGTFVFRANLGLTNTAGTDQYIAAYRLVAVFIGAFIASLCVVVRRYSMQMGGGAVARVWNMVVIAGIARAGSFLVLALLSRWSLAGAQFAEQYAIWIFAGCWLIAALYQQEVLPRVTERLAARTA